MKITLRTHGWHACKNAARRFKPRMDAHVIGGGPVAKSLALIERMRAEGATDLEIDTALAKKKLPSVIEVGRKSALHVPGWWLLTRRKKRLDRKIHALGGS